MGIDVVVSRITVIDVIPNLGHARIGANHHPVTGTADGIVLGREFDLALRRLRVVVKRLHKGVVDRRTQTIADNGDVPLKEGTRTQDVKFMS
jgi:hypothetical protein